jgi:hypothetical protein
MSMDVICGRDLRQRIGRGILNVRKLVQMTALQRYMSAKVLIHAERFHGVVSQKFERRHSLPERLSVLHNSILSRWQDYAKEPRRQRSKVISRVPALKADSMPGCWIITGIDYLAIRATRSRIPQFLWKVRRPKARIDNMMT